MFTFEREYYEYDPFWNPASTTLSEIDSKRVADILNLIPSSAHTILDVGCGNGIFCNYVKQEQPDHQVVGFDRSKAALRYVQTDKVLGDLIDIPFPDRKFDCVTALEVLEHLPIKTFASAKEELTRVSASYIIVSVPNNQQLGRHMTQCPSCKSQFDPDLHLRSFSAESLHDLFSDQGFVCELVQESGHYTQYRGFAAVRSALYAPSPSSAEMFSPLCPICGFRNEEFLKAKDTDVPPHLETQVQQKNGLVSHAKGLVKRVWPKTSESQWLIGRYRRIS